MEAAEVAIAYHLTTKHHYAQFARSLGYLDWATQPDPFRKFEGAPVFMLPLAEGDDSPAYEALYAPGAVAPRAVTAETIGLFFEDALGLSAWKEFRGSRWSLRCNPSSGNLHPTEGYLVAGPVEGLHDRPAVYHYASQEHALERRSEFGKATWRELAGAFPAGTFFAGLSSIHWREAWKYGERAYRYCQHDVGHAMAAYVLAASMLGWRCVHLDGLSDASVASLLGLDRREDFANAEWEHPDALLAVMPTAEDFLVPRGLQGEAAAVIAEGTWMGRANVLSSEHVEWKVIDFASDACLKPETEGGTAQSAKAAAWTVNEGVPAHRIIQQRRSAVDMDGQTSIGRHAFYRMLRRTVPGLCAVPWSTLAPPVAIHLGLFVHRVDGLLPGLYALVRHPDGLRSLQRAMRSTFLWEPPKSSPPDLPLYALEFGDFRGLAAQVSCHQEIAGDGAFSLGMIAEFRRNIEERGAWFYRRFFWEAGMVGQVLYLEAEAAGVRATGIGCYFDDPVHDAFGLQGLDYQSMYHFTVGGPVDDPRLTTRPPYSAERRALAAGWLGEIE